MKNVVPAALVAIVVCLGLAALPLVSPKVVRPAHAASGEGGPASNAQTYFFDMQGASPLRTSVASADTLTLANLLTLPRFYIGQADDPTRPSPAGGARETISASVRFSNSGASVSIAVATFSRIQSGGVVTERLKDLSPSYTVTASSLTDEDGLYVGPTVPLDSYAGWSARLVLMGAPSAGTVNIRPGSY